MAAAKAEALKRKRGRPTKAEIAERERKEKQAERERKRAENERYEEILKELPPIYKCTCCGKITFQPVGTFYVVNNNAFFEGNDNRSSICVDCANKFLRGYRERYNDEKLAVMLMCMHMGYFFSEHLYDTMHEKEMIDPEEEKFSFGKYVRSLSGPQYKKQNFIAYMMSLLQRRTVFKEADETREDLEMTWKLKDKQNKQQCIREIGYDPFADDVYTSSDRKQMFSSLAQYLTTGDIAEDKHKRDAAIAIVKATMQQEFLDRELNREYKNPDCDYSRVDKIINAKRQLSDIILKSAKENGISVGGGKRHRSVTAVTAIMKEMIDNGVIEAKVNLTDVKMTDVFQNIANVSARALLGEMNITGDEYAQMVAKQADTIRNLEQRMMELEEENRLLTVRLGDKNAGRNRFVSHKVDLDIGALARQREEEEAERLREEEAERNFVPEFEGVIGLGDDG